jgi:hypothetical protein
MRRGKGRFVEPLEASMVVVSALTTLNLLLGARYCDLDRITHGDRRPSSIRVDPPSSRRVRGVVHPRPAIFGRGVLGRGCDGNLPHRADGE